jgi:hypothetical protein
MWNKGRDKAERSDPLASTREELETLRGQLAGNMEDRKIEMERFKEETLWRLNALSDRTIETASMEERSVEARIAQDKAKIEAELARWKARAREQVLDEKILNALADQAVLRLLPPMEEGETGGGTS